MGATFPKAARLWRSAEFDRVRRDGRSWGGRHLVLGVLDSGVPGLARVGIITSRKVGDAHVRNRVRRRLREAVRPTRAAFRDGLFLVLIARRSAASASFAELRDELLRLAGKASILPRSS